MSIGAAGGIKSSTLAFGEDQLTKCEDHKNVGVLESYFGCFCLACMIKDPQQAQPLTKTSNFMDPLYSRSSTEAKSTTQSDPNIQQG
ncbi:hypothetical protein LguiA_036368 [Lonicera macranthoides]